MGVYKTPLQRFDVKQLSKSNTNKITPSPQPATPRPKNKELFYTKKTHRTISYFKNGNYQLKCYKCDENHPHSGEKCCKRFKNSDAGFVFDPESQKAFLDKHQQKNTPKITTCSTWSSMNSNSKTSEK